MIVCLLTGSVNLPCTFVLTAEKSLAGIILCDILVSALFAGGIFALRQVMDVKLHMRTRCWAWARPSARCATGSRGGSRPGGCPMQGLCSYL